MTANPISDSELVALIDQIDREQFAAGVSIRRRSLEVPAEACARLGHVFQFGSHEDSFSEVAIGAHRLFYREHDLAAPMIHAGIASHLNILFRIEFPLMYGSVTVNPFQFVDATDMQMRRLNTDKPAVKEMLERIIDVYDVGALLTPLHGYSKPEGKAGRYFEMAAFYMQAAVYTMTQNCPLRGCLISALTCAELAIKSALLQLGQTEPQLHELGHKLIKAKPVLSNFLSADEADVWLAVSRNPDYVSSRYDEAELDRMATYQVVKDCQFVLGSVARGFSQSSFRDKFVWES